MLGDISTLDKVYIVCGHTDMRKSIDGLCAIVEDQLKMDPESSSLFLFCGRRLSVEGRYQWPSKESEVRNLTWKQFDWLMSGIDIDQPKALKWK